MAKADATIDVANGLCVDHVPRDSIFLLCWTELYSKKVCPVGLTGHDVRSVPNRS